MLCRSLTSTAGEHTNTLFKSQSPSSASLPKIGTKLNHPASLPQPPHPHRTPMECLPVPPAMPCSALTRSRVRLPRVVRGIEPVTAPFEGRSKLEMKPVRKVLDDSVIEPVSVADFIERSKEIVRPDGGPARWFSPLEAGSRTAGSPLLLYLPGIDGTGLGLIQHHQRLGKMFDIWCLHIPVADRMPFEGLVEYVEKTAKTEHSHFPNKPIYLVGESLGACIALAVATRNPNIDFILILANPGTSFNNSQMESLLSILDVVPEPFHAAIPNLLKLLTGSPYMMTSGYVENQPFIPEVVKELSESLADALNYFSFLVNTFPKESLLWRLKMLKLASFFVNSRLHAIETQILILASGRDQLLPSRVEAERLCKALPNVRVRHFTDNSHTILLERGIDLVTIIKGAGYYRCSGNIDYVKDYRMPTPPEFQKAFQNYRWVDDLADPVMFSTLENGKMVRGLEGIPCEGPAVLVGYHMLMGFDLGSLVSRFLTEKNILLRGIAHPFMFNRASELLMPDSSSFDGMRLMGAVPASSINFYKLLLRKEFVLLFPGGAREALHRKGEQYKLFWPEQSEFVRMAAKFGATIIPFGAVGEDDILEG
ncbi:Diacylglycerol acyltransferase protein [Dioscorea alata]|uniref:Diacylglycerol acyltransferase protein n=1 Tax=Dioscorea alata TaxID=55571 RepID=A0ACB7WG89_DIOAL|nr:Diacylglycerol acyltransferase protein [Dioscorea alata]